jgi:hypothetical protein
MYARQQIKQEPMHGLPVAVKTEPKPEPVDTYRWNMPEKKPQHPILTKQSIPNRINVTSI